jgi:hypothetical protein
MGMALNDINVVDAPAFTGNAAVTSHPPAQYNIDNASVREIHHRGGDEHDAIIAVWLRGLRQNEGEE